MLGGVVILNRKPWYLLWSLTLGLAVASPVDLFVDWRPKQSSSVSGLKVQRTVTFAQATSRGQHVDRRGRCRRAVSWIGRTATKVVFLPVYGAMRLSPEVRHDWYHGRYFRFTYRGAVTIVALVAGLVVTPFYWTAVAVTTDLIVYEVGTHVDGLSGIHYRNTGEGEPLFVKLWEHWYISTPAPHASDYPTVVGPLSDEEGRLLDNLLNLGAASLTEQEREQLDHARERLLDESRQNFDQNFETTGPQERSEVTSEPSDGNEGSGF